MNCDVCVLGVPYDREVQVAAKSAMKKPNHDRPLTCGDAI